MSRESARRLVAQTRFKAMGTEVQVLAPPHELQRAKDCVQSLFAQWERTLSRFVSDSELNQLNDQAGHWVKLSPLTFAVVDAALEAAEATSGLFDPTMLRQLEAIGYAQTFEQVAPELPPLRHRLWPGGAWRKVARDATTHSVFLPNHVAIDLGGIAKGMAVDEAVEQLVRNGTGAALVNAGGDLRAFGPCPSGEAWPVQVASGPVVPLISGAMATSGIGRRQWLQGGIVRHHLLDPHTGQPAQTDLSTATVVADTCRVAEVAAKCALLLGSQAGLQFLTERQLIGWLVSGDGTVMRSGGETP